MLCGRATKLVALRSLPLVRSASSRHAAVERMTRWRAANPERDAENNRRAASAYYDRDPERRRKQWRNSHERHREASRRSVRRGRHDKRAFLAEVVGASCVDCGDDRAGAVEYHHPYGKPKGQVPLTHLSWKNLRDEAMKLIALCGACHGVRHHRERLDEAS